MRSRNTMSKIFIIFALAMAVLVETATAGAIIYQWRDDSGKLHFTDNPGAIPTQYWNQMPQISPPSAPSPMGDQGSTRVPVERTQRAIQIPISINNQYSVSAFLDTGATYCQITRDDARALGLDVESRTPVKVIMADGRWLESRVVVLDSVTIGSFEVHQVEALVGDLRLLGLNVLQQFRVTLDLPRGEIILEATNP